MKQQKYKKYRHSKYKILKEKKFGESRLQALRFAVEAAIGAIQIRIAIQTPIPKASGIQSGGPEIVDETGSEMVFGKYRLEQDVKDIFRMYNVPVEGVIKNCITFEHNVEETNNFIKKYLSNEKTQKH